MANDGQPKVLVSCIGQNPASAVIAARHYGVSRAVLLGTTTTRQQIDAVTEQIDVPTTPIEFESSRATIGNVRQRLIRDLNLRDDERIVLDLTGATKLLTIGTWSAMESQPHSRVDVVYLEPNGELLDPIYNRRIIHNVVIEIDEVLQWQGASCKTAHWRGKLADVDREIAGRAALGRFLVQALGQRRLSIRTNNNTATVSPDRVPPNLPRGFQLRPNRTIRSSIPGYFAQNRWLEEVCLHRVRQMFGHCPITHAAAGQTLTIAGVNAIDEADVVLVRGPRICIIEAKARISGAGAGADLQKRVAKTKNYFGGHASVIFVHPAWGKNPPRELVERAKRDATLVGANIADLDRAIFDALRFERDDQPGVG